MNIREDGRVCLPPMWWLGASVLYLRAVRVTLFLPACLWLFGKWTLKEAVIGFVAAVAFQWLALIALKLVEELFFVKDISNLPGTDEIDENE